MARKVIGIDFGSTQSTISMMTIGSNCAPDLLPVGSGINGRTIPTQMAIGVNDDSVKAIGTKVSDYEKDSNGIKVKFVRDFKRYLGDPEAGASEDDSIRNANEYCREFIKYLAQKVKEHEHKLEDRGDNLDPKEYVTCIAHPATWTEAQVSLLKQYARDAGLPADSDDGVYTISEPEAAMHALRVKDSGKFRFGDRPEFYMVIDFGGGTLDICIIKTGILGKNPKIVKNSTSGDAKLGGKDFDDILETLFFRQNPGLDRGKMEACEKAELRDKLKEAKEWFSMNFKKNDDLSCPIVIPSGNFVFKLSKQQFEGLIEAKGYYEKIKESIQKSLADARIDVANITKVILTGGSSQWFFMRKLVAQTLDLCDDKVVDSEQPYFDVASGCAVSIGRTSEPKMRNGVWIKWRIKNKNMEWSEPICLLQPARINASTKSESQYIGKLPGTQYFASYEIEIMWMTGLDEKNLRDSKKTAIIEFYARSNSPAFDAFVGMARGLSRKPYTPMDDKYEMYLQYQEDEESEGAKYHFEILDVDAAKRERTRIRNGDVAANKMPKGHTEEGDIIAGYVSRCSFWGLGARKLIKL